MVLRTCCLIVALLGLAILAPSGSQGADAEPITQPIPYNHKVHIEKELQCTFCHTRAEQGEVAGRPTTEICTMCHAQIEGPASTQIADYAARKEPIPWNRIYDVPDFVYFSHRRHTKVAQVECSTCHGNVAALAQPAEAPLVDLSMTFCIECHRQRAVSTDCNACHR